MMSKLYVFVIAFVLLVLMPGCGSVPQSEIMVCDNNVEIQMVMRRMTMECMNRGWPPKECRIVPTRLFCDRK